MHDIDLASQYQIPFSSFDLMSVAFCGCCRIPECIQGQTKGSFCSSKYKQMQNMKCHTYYWIHTIVSSILANIHDMWPCARTGNYLLVIMTGYVY